ncbi:ATP-binding protein [Vibrio ponticus]|uniref:ATP-binding protein n=1 Tax=Vibrio ponticus TaxID=265668 RepID=A0A3N3DY63_9VIBR|nr:ATP-binding protein [Vibrio ponticus]ROV59467.1 ATP-binding protein [Vibrio ponticus]
MPKLILIRGLPGSGKSTLAKTFQAQHFEADMYFIDKNGEYRFNPTLLEQAHAWCKQQTEQALRRGEDVVVANTFVRRWEIQPYYQLARKLKVEFEIIECHGEYGSIHGVEQSVIEKMRAKWQEWRV